MYKRQAVFRPHGLHMAAHADATPMVKLTSLQVMHAPAKVDVAIQ